MQNGISSKFYNVRSTDSQQFAFRAGLSVLIGFAILRPLTLMGKDFGIYGVNILEIFGTGISYFFLLPIIGGLKQFKLDRLNIFLLIFSLYSIESLLWGSKIREVAILILPFLLFFSVRTFIKDSKQLRTLLIAIFFGFLIPITLSTFNITTGRNIHLVEFWNQLPRHAGAFGGSHTLAYIMLLVSFFFCILYKTYQFKNIINRSIIYILLILSFFCLYQSHTRTAIIGFMLFWFIYLFGNSKKLFFLAVLLIIVAGVIFQAQIRSLFWKTPEEPNIERATSGRISMSKNNLKLFIDSSLPKKLVGHGLSEENPFGYHNDYMRILISLGLIGISLYLTLIFYIFWDIFLCNDKKTKYLFGAIFVSVVAMNFGSNGFVFRIELSQYFWLIIGLFYFQKEIRAVDYDTKQS